MRMPLQVPPATPNGQFGIRLETMVHDQPVGGVAGPEGLHDQQHANLAYDMIGHHPQPLRVSNFRLLGIEPRFTDDIRHIIAPSSPIRIPRCSSCPRHSGTGTTQCSSGYQLMSS